MCRSNEYCDVAVQYKFLGAINTLSVRDDHDKLGIYLSVHQSCVIRGGNILFVVKRDSLRGRVGQPSQPIALNPDGAFSIGVQIGRRNLDVALLDFTGAPFLPLHPNFSPVHESFLKRGRG
jgi:hypothetical protein